MYLQEIILPLIIAYFVTVAVGPVLIPWLKKLKVGNTEREELESHQVKNGTPTMGGLLILAGLTVAVLISIGKYPKVLPVLILTWGYAVIGFLDDYLKVVLKRSDGLLSYQKMLLQIVVTAVFAAYMVFFSGNDLTLLIPFSQYFVAGGYYLNAGFLTIPLMFFVVIGTANGVNFTDGLDGLLSTVTLPVSLFFICVSLYKTEQVALLPAAVIGALLGFLMFNAYPAKIFMGDTGSLALGGYVAGMAYILKLPLYLPIVGFIYFVEVLSVIIQVSYFKYTKKKYGQGKRIFKMTPIHHHYELKGYSETKVVAFFAVVTALLCLVGFAGICGGKL
ncbi:MAG: phospho-N-acetylmuramoyl-pentapeptide-transferase [Lachnospiraceae bacterium]|nr:phospho-N-acetylmuramoyl-pentapeptide-transferase [Lachnospiraceae bacterium]